MDALAAIAARHSTRVYADQPVDREIVEKIVLAGLQAPTARNVQPWEFVVVTAAETRRQIAALAEHGRFIAQAPACVAVFCRDTKYYLEDGCAATENILVAAASLGVQSCWVAGDKKPYGREVGMLLGVPEDCKLVALVALGYQAVAGRQPKRRDLSRVLHWECF